MFVELHFHVRSMLNSALMIPLNPCNNLGDRFYYDSYFTDEETVIPGA